MGFDDELHQRKAHAGVFVYMGLAGYKEFEFAQEYLIGETVSFVGDAKTNSSAGIGVDANGYLASLRRKTGWALSRF